jgi:hypothetical protein
MDPEVASSLNRNFSKCSWSRLRYEATCGKFVRIVLVPSRWPSIFGISNLALDFSMGLRSLYASFNKVS